MVNVSFEGKRKKRGKKKALLTKIIPLLPLRVVPVERRRHKDSNNMAKGNFYCWECHTSYLKTVNASNIPALMLYALTTFYLNNILY